MAHSWPDGSEHPVAFASRSLTKTERNYSQLEKEGLAYVFGVTKFHSYLFGHPFDLITDHKPLLTLLNEHKPTSPQASARIRRWFLLLPAYEYTMKFRCTGEHGNADALSRVSLREIPAQTETPAELVLLIGAPCRLRSQPNRIKCGLEGIQPCPQFYTTYSMVGQPRSTQTFLATFPDGPSFQFTKDVCYGGSRIAIPPQGCVRTAVLQEIHEGHTGMSYMKTLAHMYV